jgi:O-antigen/teichoic acid export membrane protein
MLGFSAASWKRVSAEAGWSLLMQASIAISGLVALRLFTELASKDVFGHANLLLGIVALFKSLFVAPINNAQIRYQPEFDASGIGGWFQRAILRRSLQMAAVAALVGLPAVLAWNHVAAPPITTGLYLAMAALLFSDCLESIWGTPIVSRRNQRFNALWHIYKNWAFALFGTFALYLSASAFSYLAGQTLASVTALLLFGVAFYPRQPADARDPRPEERGAARAQVLQYALPFPALAVIGWLANVGERYVLGGKLGTDDVAVFVAAYSVASRPLMIAGGVISVFARPILFQAEAVGDTRKARKVFLLWLTAMVGMGVAGVLALWLLGPLLARVTLASAYREGATAFFVWIGATHAVINVSQLLETRLMSLGRTGRLLAPTVVAAAANIALAYLILSRGGDALNVAQGKLFAILMASAVLAGTLATMRRADLRKDEGHG